MQERRNSSKHKEMYLDRNKCGENFNSKEKKERAEVNQSKIILNFFFFCIKWYLKVIIYSNVNARKL